MPKTKNSAVRCTQLECIRYMNGTGHVQGLRAWFREHLSPQDAVDRERVLDAIIERSIEIAISA